MASGGQVLTLLCPNVEWTIEGNDYDSIDWQGNNPAITKQEFENGLANYDDMKAAEQATKTIQRQALLDKLGITEEEARLLLGGN